MNTESNDPNNSHVTIDAGKTSKCHKHCKHIKNPKGKKRSKPTNINN